MKKQCAICGNCYEKVKPHCSHTVTFQDKPLVTLKRLVRLSSGLNSILSSFTTPATEVLCLCLALLMGPSSSQRCAAQIEKQQKVAFAYYRRITLRDILPPGVLAAKMGPGKSWVFVTKKCKSFFGNKETNNWLILNSMTQRP